MERRYRITDTPTETVTGYQHTNNCGSTWTAIDPDKKHLSEVNFKEMSGQDIGDYYARLQRGELLPFTYYNYLTVEGSSDGDRTVWITATGCPSDKYQFWSKYQGWVISRESFTPYIEELKALQPALLQRAAAQQASAGFDASTFLAELHKTIGLFKNLPSRLGSLAESGKIGSAWLEGRYGWRQILFDIEGVNEAIDKLCATDTYTRYKTHATSSRSWTNVEEDSWTYGSTGVLALRKTDTITGSVIARVVADHTPEAIDFNPITTAWELVPFSFVIDWVVSVGSWLESLSFLSTGVNHVQAAGYKIDIQRDYSIWTTSSLAPYTSDTWQEATCEATLVDRTPAQVSLTPLFNLRLDGFKVLDLVALFLQKLGGK